MMREFTIYKSSGSHADIFAAAGLANLLAPVTAVIIENRGTSFAVMTDRDLAGDDFRNLDGTPGYKYLRTKVNKPLPDGVREADVLDYGIEEARFQRYAGAQKARRLDPGAKADIDADAPLEDWRLYQALNALQGHDCTNKAAAAILKSGPEAWKRNLRNALEALSLGRVPALNWKLNLVQLFTPEAAKGYARLKPDSTNRNDSTKNRWAQPFLEWLKFRGYFSVAAPFFVGPDVRIFCPIPHCIDYRFLRHAVGELRKAQISGSARSAPKLDCLTVLKFAELLIRHSPEYLSDSTIPPVKLVSGLTVAHYQSMGHSKAVTAIEQLAVPDWFSITGADDANRWLDILDEHQKVIRSLHDERSDEIGLLLSYRRFLQMPGPRALEALIGFVADYGLLLMREREKGRLLKQFSIKHLKDIAMDQPNYMEILENPGFKAIAAAIRSSTVSAQARKRLGANDYRDIRYDLLPELRRKAKLPGVEPLLETVSDFVASYNAESARRFETGKATGIGRVTTEELECFVALLTSHKPSTVGAMLCAYASCREPREPEPEAEPETIETMEIKDA